MDYSKLIFDFCLKKKGNRIFAQEQTRRNKQDKKRFRQNSGEQVQYQKWYSQSERDFGCCWRH